MTFSWDFQAGLNRTDDGAYIMGHNSFANNSHDYQLSFFLLIKKNHSLCSMSLLVSVAVKWLPFVQRYYVTRHPARNALRVEHGLLVTTTCGHVSRVVLYCKRKYVGITLTHST